MTTEKTRANGWYAHKKWADEPYRNSRPSNDGTALLDVFIFLQGLFLVFVLVGCWVDFWAYAHTAAMGGGTLAILLWVRRTLR